MSLDRLRLDVTSCIFWLHDFPPSHLVSAFSLHQDYYQMSRKP
ncbi:hypothetical protein ID866_10384 [Astraeus odoratus]|nr:hypothetical protein ID866_10384 [Astraeus odoratus]